MGYPSEGVEALYRNSMSEVKRFFKERHGDKYKIYNLCAERQYDITQHFPHCERFGFEDHNAAPFALIEPFCQSVHAWLEDNPDNVAAIHCKAGKGRTGMMICCYLVHSGRCATADEALVFFGDERTMNRKGVTIPSQMRYVHYYEQYLRHGAQAATPFTYQITHIRLVTVPCFDSTLVGGGCDPYFQVYSYTLTPDGRSVKKKKIYDFAKQAGQKLRHFKKDERFVDLDCSTHNLKVKGDIKLVFYDRDRYNADDKMFHLWFNTGFIENNYLCFEKAVLDKACKDKQGKRFDPNFKLEIFLHKVDDDLNLDAMPALPQEEGEDNPADIEDD